MDEPQAKGGITGAGGAGLPLGQGAGGAPQGQRPIRYMPPVIPPPPAAPQPAVAPQQQEKATIKETIESILVAFILAFEFRAFVAGAFVIPSGSSAPALLRGHTRFGCGGFG